MSAQPAVELAKQLTKREANAFTRGLRAAERGRPASGNPYKKELELKKAWQVGYEIYLFCQLFVE